MAWSASALRPRLRYPRPPARLRPPRPIGVGHVDSPRAPRAPSPVPRPPPPSTAPAGAQAARHDPARHPSWACRHALTRETRENGAPRGSAATHAAAAAAHAASHARAGGGGGTIMAPVGAAVSAVATTASAAITTVVGRARRGSMTTGLGKERSRVEGSRRRRGDGQGVVRWGGQTAR